MLIKNIDEQLVNGSIGKVIAFVDVAGFAAMRNGGAEEVVEEVEGEKKKPKASAASGVRMPVVRFVLPGGGKRDYHVQQEDFKVELPSGEVQASRKQVPLVCEFRTSSFGSSC